MKSKADLHTLELPGLPKPRGRPRTGKAVPTKERVRAYRSRKAAEHARLAEHFKDFNDVTLARYIILLDDDTMSRECWVELGRRFGWR